MRATASWKLRLSVEHGTLTPLPAGSGVTPTGNGTGDVVLTGTWRISMPRLRAGWTYQGERDFNGQDALTMVTNDRATPAVVAPSERRFRRAAHEVQPVNDAPVNQVSDAMAVKEDGSLSLSRHQRQGCGCGQPPCPWCCGVGARGADPAGDGRRRLGAGRVPTW